jgi:hypothetical protein
MNGTSSPETIERCEREVDECRRAGENPNLTPAQQLGAIQGEVDWLVALQIATDDLVSAKGKSYEDVMGALIQACAEAALPSSG